MTNLTYRLSWLAALAVYWFFALGLLFYASPISWDASGPSATFHWGSIASPTQGEWNESLALRLQFYKPYLVVASFMTLIGGGLAMLMATRRHLKRKWLFIATSSGTLTALLLSAAVSDLGTSFRLWIGPSVFYLTLPDRTVFLYRDMVLYCMQSVVPVSALAGLLAIARARILSAS